MRQVLPDEALKRISKNVKAQEGKSDKPDIIANLGDVNFIDYGGLLIVQTQYGPEGWYVENDLDWNPDAENEYQATWTISRFDIEKFAEIDGYLVPDVALTFNRGVSRFDEPFWAKDLEGVADSVGSSKEELVNELKSDDPAERGQAYRDLIWYFGPFEFDQYPLTLNYKEVHELFGEEYDTDWDKPEEEEFEDDEEDFGREGRRKKANLDALLSQYPVKDIVDQDVFYPQDADSPVSVVGVYDGDEMEADSYVVITGRGIDHGLEKAHDAFFNDKLSEELDEGLWNEIREEFGPDADQYQIEEAYMNAITEGWQYWSEEFDTLEDFVQTLRASEHPEAKLWLRGFEDDEEDFE